MSSFGDLVKRLRKDRSMTLEQVARKVGSHKGYVSGIENGKVNPPSVKFIRKFAKLFSHDERDMVRMAFVDKAPKLIREEVARIFSGAAPSGGQTPTPARSGSNGRDLVQVPLLNTVSTGYSTELADGRPKPLTGAVLSLPKSAGAAQLAATVCDDSMERAEGLSLAKGEVVLLAPMAKIKNGSLVFAVYNAKSRRSGIIRQVMLEQNDHVVLQPLNKEYPLEFLSHDDIDAVFQVVGRLEVFEGASVDSAV